MTTAASTPATPLQQALPEVLAAATAAPAAMTAVLTDIADLIEHTDTVRERLTQRLAADGRLYTDALRILLAQAVPAAAPALEVLHELTHQARHRIQAPEAASAATATDKDDRP